MIELPVEQGQTRSSAGLTLVLGAGGVRGFAHIGVLEALVKRDLRPEAIIGTSAGALVAACYAALGWDPARLVEMARAMGPLAALALLARRPLFSKLQSLRRGSPSWISGLLEDLARADYDQLHQGVRSLGVTCFDMISRAEMFFVTGGVGPRPPLADAVLGSATLPLLFPARSVAVDGVRMRLVDGGLSRTLPVERAFAPPVSARRVLAIDLGVCRGWNERPLDHQDRLRRRFGHSLVILKPDVKTFGTVTMRRGDPERLILAGHEAATAFLDDTATVK